jgi:hypothetical protein
MRIFFLYKTTNKINNKFYIGVHSTTDIDDGYLGSGILLLRSIKKYGSENFERKILKFFENKEDMFRAEKDIVNKDLIHDPLCLNLKIGGYGGWILKDRSSCYSSRLQIKRSPFSKKEWRECHSEDIKKWSLIGLVKCNEKIKNMREGGWKSKGFSGCSHTDEFKEKIGKVLSKAQAGENNSQYGKCWIHSPIEKRSIKVHKDDAQKWVEDGWILGRKMKFE